jgi:putative tryptophan/tyrosine transport system substrate-binding protein
MNRRAFVTLLGGAAAWPLAARAQQQADRMRPIGVLMGYSESDPESQRWVRAFEQGLQQKGWSKDTTIAVDYRWAMGDLDRMRAYAAELVSLKPDVILAASSPAVAAMRQQTASVPIVFVNVADPIGQGFVRSLARPDGNITGFAALESSTLGKSVEILKAISPSLLHAVILFNPATAPYFPDFYRAIEMAASQLAVKPIATPVQDAAAIERAINAVEPVAMTGLIVFPSAFMTIHRDLIISSAARKRLPAIYGYAYYVASGGLVSYGIDARDLFVRASFYVDRILRGAKPAELPVQQPTKFELVINMKTAKELGLDIPLNLQQIADEVIE